MKLRVKPFRYRDAGSTHTVWLVEVLRWYGWEDLYHCGHFVWFGTREYALEYIRLYRALKKRR